MKYVAIAIALFIAGVFVLQLEGDREPLVPVVRVRTDNGLFMTLVQKPIAKQALCSEAVDNLVGRLAKACATCTVESTECATKLRGIDDMLARNVPAPLYVVASDEIRIGIIGPPESVRARCEGMAAVMVSGGVKSACIPPAPAS